MRDDCKVCRENKTKGRCDRKKAGWNATEFKL